MLTAAQSLRSTTRTGGTLDLGGQPGVGGDVPGGLVGQRRAARPPPGWPRRRTPRVRISPARPRWRRPDPSQRTAPCTHRTRGATSAGLWRNPQVAGRSAAAGDQLGRDPVAAPPGRRPSSPVPSARIAKTSSRPSAVTSCAGDRVDPGQRAGLGPDHALADPVRAAARRTGSRSVPDQPATGSPPNIGGQRRAACRSRPASSRSVSSVGLIRLLPGQAAGVGQAGLVGRQAQLAQLGDHRLGRAGERGRLARRPARPGGPAPRRSRCRSAPASSRPACTSGGDSTRPSSAPGAGPAAPAAGDRRPACRGSAAAGAVPCVTGRRRQPELLGERLAGGQRRVARSAGRRRTRCAPA